MTALETLDTFVLDTPIGKIKMYGDKEALYKIEFNEVTETNLPGYPKVINFAVMYLQASKTPNFLFKKAIKDLAAYFDQGARNFSVNVNFEWLGTPLQQETWRILRTIPYGVTVSMPDLARALGTEDIDAVKEAVDANPIPIVIPSHRIVETGFGFTPEIGGFSYGKWRKEWMLNHEQVAQGKQKREII